MCIHQDKCLENNDVVFIDPDEEKRTWMNFKVIDGKLYMPVGKRPTESTIKWAQREWNRRDKKH